MKKLFTAFSFGLFGIIAIACSNQPAPSNQSQGSTTPAPSSTAANTSTTPISAAETGELAVIETDYGKIKIRFYPDIAPRHVENFKKLTHEKFYDGLAFHRVIPGNIIQGGDPTTRSGDPSQWGMGMPGQATVPAEFSSRPFIKGSVGMARRGGDNDSATSQFFICLKEHPEWDGQYTVFGEVVQGIETVRMISEVESDPASQKVKKKVVMNRVYLEKAKKTDESPVKAK